MSSSDKVPYHLAYDINGKLITPEPKTIEEHAAWWVGLARALWLDLWYLILAVLALLLLITCCVCVPGLRDLSIVKEKVKPVADWTVATATAAAAATGACLGATWAAIAKFFSDLLSKLKNCMTPAAGASSAAVPAYVPLDEEAGAGAAKPAAADPSPPAPPTYAPAPPAEPEPAPVPVVTPAATSASAGPAVGVGTLTMHLKSGFKLEGKDKSGKSDPFCIVTLPGEKPVNSVVVKQTLSPVWDNHFSVSGKTLQQLSAIGPIKVEVFDKDMTGKESIGNLELPASKWNMLEAGQIVQFSNLPLSNSTTGQISFSLCFEPVGSQPPSA